MLFIQLTGIYRGDIIYLILFVFVVNIASSSLVSSFSSNRHFYIPKTTSWTQPCLASMSTEYNQQLKVVSPSDVKAMRFDPVDPTAREQASAILKEVREKGLDGLLTQASKLGDIPNKDAKYIYNKVDLEDAFKSLDIEQQVEQLRLITFPNYPSIFLLFMWCRGC